MADHLIYKGHHGIIMSQCLDVAIAALRVLEDRAESAEARSTALEARLEVAMMRGYERDLITSSPSRRGRDLESDAPTIGWKHDREWKEHDREWKAVQHVSECRLTTTTATSPPHVAGYPRRCRSCALFGENDENDNAQQVQLGAYSASHPLHLPSTASEPLSPAGNCNICPIHGRILHEAVGDSRRGGNVSGILLGGTPTRGRRVWASKAVMASPKVQLMDAVRESNDLVSVQAAVKPAG